MNGQLSGTFDSRSFAYSFTSLGLDCWHLGTCAGSPCLAPSHYNKEKGKWFSFVLCFVFWCWGLNPGPWPWATTPAFFWYFETRSCYVTKLSRLGSNLWLSTEFVSKHHCIPWKDFYFPLKLWPNQLRGTREGWEVGPLHGACLSLSSEGTGGRSLRKLIVHPHMWNSPGWPHPDPQSTQGLFCQLEWDRKKPLWIGRPLRTACDGKKEAKEVENLMVAVTQWTEVSFLITISREIWDHVTCVTWVLTILKCIQWKPQVSGSKQ